MKHLNILCLMLTVLGTQLCAQDSLVRYSEVKFSSDFESSAFYAFTKKNDKKQSLALLLALTPNVNQQELGNISNRINGVENLLISGGIEKKKPEKKVKAVYDQVHSTFLKKYEMENRFHEIFTTGNYNCVTATALYALVFDGLEIPYEIKEEPTHVYLLAYPNANNILVETTAPLFGFMTFDSQFKEKFVSNLKSQKIIGANEFEKKSTEELFNSYYFQNEKIDIKKLIGIHYMNDALFKNDHNKNIEAFQQAEKAYFFYPSTRCEYLLMSFGSSVIAQEKLSPKDKAILIGKLSRYKNHGITPDMIKAEFTNLTQDVLLRDNNKVLYKECFQLVSSGTSDADLRNDLAFIFNYENGRVYYNQGNYDRAKPYFKQALTLQPNNVDLGGILVGVIAQSFRSTKENKSVFDSLTYYQSTFPSLGQNNNFNSMVAAANLIQFGDEYKNGRAVEGEKYRIVFESMITSNPNLNINHVAVGGSYSAACVYYFKKGQKTKAKEVLQKGLEISPENYELRMRQQMLSN